MNLHEGLTRFSPSFPATSKCTCCPTRRRAASGRPKLRSTPSTPPLTKYSRWARRRKGPRRKESFTIWGPRKATETATQRRHLPQGPLPPSFGYNKNLVHKEGCIKFWDWQRRKICQSKTWSRSEGDKAVRSTNFGNIPSHISAVLCTEISIVI